MTNLLIVDDEQSYRQLLTLVFEGDGHNIKTARNGREAIEILEQESADIIISDVKMPDNSAFPLVNLRLTFNARTIKNQ